MGKSSLRKNHKQKVAARNKRESDEKNRLRKLISQAYLKQKENEQKTEQ